MARKKQVGLEGIETGPMSVPKMDRISVTFALMLDSFILEDKGCVGDKALYLTCIHCHDDICTVDDGDTMRVLFNTALAHTC